MCLEMFMVVFSGKRKRFYKVSREQNQKQSSKTAFLMAELKKMVNLPCLPITPDVL